MSKVQLSGNHFHRALAYAHAVCPKSEGKGRLAHVVFIDSKIVASDGECYQVGILPDEARFEALAVTRLSVDDLLLALAYTGRVARAHSRDFTVTMDGPSVSIRYGAKGALVHELEPCDLGPLPKKWAEPVSKRSPEVSGSQLPELHCGSVKRAMGWHRSWEKDAGSFTWRYSGGGWVRLDIVAEGEHVASAFITPTTQVPAQLPPDEPLLEHGKKVKRGQSVLDLSLDIAAPVEAEPPAEPRRRRKGKVVEEGDQEENEGGEAH